MILKRRLIGKYAFGLGTVGAASLLMLLSSCGSISFSKGYVANGRSAQDSAEAGEENGEGSESNNQDSVGDTDNVAASGEESGSDSKTAISSDVRSSSDQKVVTNGSKNAGTNASSDEAAQNFEAWVMAQTVTGKARYNLERSYPVIRDASFDELYLAAAQAELEKEALTTNEVVQKDKALISALQAYDPADPFTVSAIEAALSGKSLGQEETTGHSYSYSFNAQEGHCYIPVGKWKNRLGSETVTDSWSTQHILKYQVLDVELLTNYEPGKSIENRDYNSRGHLIGVCVTTDEKLNYDMTLEFPGNKNAYQFSIIDIKKEDMPNYIKVQTISHAMDDICTPYLWAEHWVNPVPGTLYFYDKKPVLVTEHHWAELGRYRVFPTEFNVVTPYFETAVTDWKNIVSTTDSLSIPVNHLQIPTVCPDVSINEALSRCEDSSESSYECCKTNVTELMAEKIEAQANAAIASEREKIRAKKENTTNMMIHNFCGASQENYDYFYGNVIDAIAPQRTVETYSISDYFTNL